MRVYRWGIVAAAIALSGVPLHQTDAQVPQRQAQRRPTGAVQLQLLPMVSVSVTEPIYVKTITDVRVHIRNLRDVPHTIQLLVVKPTKCSARGYASRRLTVTPVGGEVTFMADVSFDSLGARGHSCPLAIDLTAMQSAESKVDAGSVPVEAGQTYTIDNTWDVVPWILPIKPGKADQYGSAQQGECNGFSAGLSGVMPIGVVEHDHDLSFQLRSGIYPSTCSYQPDRSRMTRLNQPWYIIGRTWKIERARGASDACKVDSNLAENPAGRAFLIMYTLSCGGGPDNDNGVRLILQSLTLIGPPNRTPLEAFIQ
jgi:hypothetical protein